MFKKIVYIAETWSEVGSKHFIFLTAHVARYTSESLVLFLFHVAFPTLTLPLCPKARSVKKDVFSRF